jgi:4-hydroxy-tetrahydrodipicolinate synthase
LFAYFSELVHRLDTSTMIYLYHFPQQSAVPFTFDLVARLLRSFPGKIAGIKDSSGDLANTLGYIKNFAADGFEVYSGDDSALLDVLKAGAAGCITAAANVGSRVSAMVVADWDNDAAMEPQAKLKSLRKLFSSVPLIPSLKAVLGRRLDDPAWLHVRPPHLGLSDETTQRLFAGLEACQLPLEKVA